MVNLFAYNIYINHAALYGVEHLNAMKKKQQILSIFLTFEERRKKTKTPIMSTELDKRLLRHFISDMQYKIRWHFIIYKCSHINIHYHTRRYYWILNSLLLFDSLLYFLFLVWCCFMETKNKCQNVFAWKPIFFTRK